MLSASYGTEDREIFSVVGGQAAAAGGNDTRTEAGRALRRGEAGDAAWYDIHLPPQPQCCLHNLWMMERWQIRLEPKSLVRGALLHDYFLYDWHQKDPSHRLHGFRHPKTALGNAQRDYHLNWKEKNIIARHMFPLIPVPPQCREAWIVCLADKWCALGETVEPMFHVKHFK